MSGTLVLLYHRVAHLERDPHGLAVRPDRFSQHCEILRRRCAVVPLSEADRSKREVAITFDDGYADNAADARRILAATGLPATFFICSGRVGKGGEAWWDRLEHMLLDFEPARTTLELAVDGRSFWADIRSPAARERAHWALFWRLRPMRPTAIDSVLDDLQAQLGVRTLERDSHRWMNADELRTLSETNGIDVGAHTITHPLLSLLTAEEQSREVRGSRDHLERLLDRRVRLFSYPFGDRNSFDTVTTQMVRNAGYTMACTVTGGLAKAGCDPLCIPRNVVGDWDAERFGRWLDGWLSEP